MYQLDETASMANLARRYGVDLQPDGDYLTGHCPFHEDTGLSLIISQVENSWRCTASCRASGGPMEWVQKFEGVSRKHAVEILKGRTGACASSDLRHPVKISSTPKFVAPVSPSCNDQEIYTSIINFYHETLRESSEAGAYLEKRRIGHPDVVSKFKLGYANRTLGYRLPAKNRMLGGKLRGRLTELGLYRTSGHEHFSGCLVMPVFDGHGELTGIFGRKVRDDLRAGTEKRLYLSIKEPALFNAQTLSVYSEIILCQSVIDALTFWCAGFTNVTALPGRREFTNAHLDVFDKYGAKKIYVALPRRTGDEKILDSLSSKLIERGHEVFHVEFPHDQDANAFALSVSDPADSLGQLIRGASWLGKGINHSSISIEPPIEPDASSDAEATASEKSGQKSQDLIDQSFAGRAWRVCGLNKNTVYGVLKLNVRISFGERFHMDTVDLANARLRAMFLKAAAVETDLAENILKDDMRKLLLKLEELQDALIQRKLKPREPVVEMSDGERAEALAFLKAPDLLDRIKNDFESIGVVGEEINLLTGYLACVSRKFNDPLAIIIQSASASGKTALLDAILSFMPDEDRIKFSAVTGQALFYMDGRDLKHKILALVEDRGALKSSYALKLLQSDGRLKIASTGKNPDTGKLVAHDYSVEGPVALLVTTTNVEIDDELLNRSLLLSVNEDRDQTQKIHDAQRQNETLHGILRHRSRAEILRRHQNAQRLLRPLNVSNPFAPKLTFLDSELRTRRDHSKYLALIRSIALLHQYQRPVKQVRDGSAVVSYIEVIPADIELANRIASSVMGRSLDEIPPQTRHLLLLLENMVKARCDESGLTRPQFRFSRRDARLFTTWGDTALKVHIARLVDLEYLLIHRGRGQSYVYELLYDGQGKTGRPFCMGLTNASTVIDSPESENVVVRVGDGRQLVSPRSGGGQGKKFRATHSVSLASRSLLQNQAKTHCTVTCDSPPVVGRSDA